MCSANDIILYRTKSLVYEEGIRLLLYARNFFYFFSFLSFFLRVYCRQNLRFQIPSASTFDAFTKFQLPLKTSAKTQKGQIKYQRLPSVRVAYQRSSRLFAISQSTRLDDHFETSWVYRARHAAASVKKRIKKE